jgi:molecular chaperone DnaK (HSP70)
MLSFFALIATRDLLAVDVGSSFLKFARGNTTAQSIDPYSVPGAGSIVPSALAFTGSASDSFEVAIGQSALPFLASNTSSGYRHLPRLLGRNSSAFTISPIAGPLESLAILWAELQSLIRTFPQFVAAVPVYWTYGMRQALLDSLALGHAPLYAVVDDISALAMLYLREKGTVYRNERGRWFVVFVDIGDLSVKVYGIGLLTQGGVTCAQQSRMFWSEDLGGYHFVRAVSKRLGVDFWAAEELISQEDEKAIEALMPELNELKKLVLLGFVEGRTSDVQVIGGGSLYNFVHKVITKAAGTIPVRSDFNARFAVAQGALEYAYYQEQIKSGRVPESTRYLVVSAISNVSLVCSKSHPYCERGKSCLTSISDDGLCDIAKLVATEDGIPKDVSTTIGSFQVSGLEDAPAGSRLKFQCKAEGPFILSAERCLAQNCDPVNVTLLSSSDLDAKEVFVNKVMRAKLMKQQSQRLIDKIDALLEKVVAAIDDLVSDLKIEKMPENAEMMFTQVNDIRNKAMAGDLKKLNRMQLTTIATQLTQIAEALGVPRS